MRNINMFAYHNVKIHNWTGKNKIQQRVNDSVTSVNSMSVSVIIHQITRLIFTLKHYASLFYQTKASFFILYSFIYSMNDNN